VLGWATLHDHLHTPVAQYLLANGTRHNIFTAVATGDVEAIRALAAVSRDVLDKPMAIWESRRRPLHLSVLKNQPHLAVRRYDTAWSSRTRGGPLLRRRSAGHSPCAR
jgi:hypothetical protein